MPQRAGGRFNLWLFLLSVGALVAPVVWILTTKMHTLPTGDAFYFHWQASFIADGAGWFISPFPYLYHHAAVASASHPPLWILVLAFGDVLGLKSYPSQLLEASVIGAAAVFLTGLVARKVAGPRAGLIAAAIAALYPNFWINYGLGLSETLILLLVASVILVALSFWEKPSLPRAAGLGLLCALAALTRAEQVLLLPLVLVPLALLLRGVDLRRRLLYAAVGIVVAGVTIAPWVGFNESRFSHSTFFSTDSGTTLAMANCRSTYYGHYLGADDFRCVNRIKAVAGDESVQDAEYRRVAVGYLNEHITRVPLVMVTRFGREFGLFQPFNQLQLEIDINHRPLRLAEIGLFMYYAMVLASVYGAIILGRRKMTLVPFFGIFLELAVTAMLTFGQTRYRAPLEVVLVVLSAVAIDALLTRGRPLVRRHALPGERTDSRREVGTSSQ